MERNSVRLSPGEALAAVSYAGIAVKLDFLILHRPQKDTALLFASAAFNTFLSEGHLLRTSGTRGPEKLACEAGAPKTLRGGQRGVRVLL